MRVQGALPPGLRWIRFTSRPGEVIALVVEFAPQSCGTYDAVPRVKTPLETDTGETVTLHGTANFGNFDGGSGRCRHGRTLHASSGA